MQSGGAEQPKILEVVTLSYVALPFLIFLLGWLRPGFAVPAAVLSFAGIWQASRTPSQVERHDRGWRDVLASLTPKDITTLAGLALLVGFLVLYSGAGGYAFQYQDYSRHNAFLLDLMERPWPLAFERTPPHGEPGVLAFYIANTLPAATVGKWLGWQAANLASLIWTWLGVYLAVLWFLRVVGRLSFAVALLFLFFGGLDIIGRSVLLGFPTDPIKLLGNWMVEYSVGPVASGEPMRLSGVFFYYPSNLSFVYYAPQHVLGPWLCVLMILYDAVRLKTCKRSVFLWSLTLLWSAFAFLGALPILATALVLTRGRNLISFENACVGGLVGITTFLYVGSNNGTFVRRFLWDAHDLIELLPFLLFFYALEFGVYALICPRPRADDPRRIDTAWLGASIACLLLAPWYLLGRFNDLTTKASIPALIVLQVWIAIAILGARGGGQRIRAGILVGLLILGSLASLSDVSRGLAHGLEWRSSSRDRPVVRTNRFIGLGGQLFSDGEGFFWKHLAREPQYR